MEIICCIKIQFLFLRSFLLISQTLNYLFTVKVKLQCFFAQVVKLVGVNCKPRCESAPDDLNIFDKLWRHPTNFCSHFCIFKGSSCNIPSCCVASSAISSLINCEAQLVQEFFFYLFLTGFLFFTLFFCPSSPNFLVSCL